MRKTNLILEVILLLSTVEIASGQAAPNINQTATRSTCSNIVALSGAKVDCSHLTQAQRDALANIPEILKMAFENKSYLDAILKQLREMSAPQPVTNNYAPGGFATSGGTLINPQVTNLGPPPATIEHFEIIPADPSTAAEGKPRTAFRFTLSAPLGDQKFIAICSRPCTAVDGVASPRPSVLLSSDVTTGGWADAPTRVAWVVNIPMHADQFWVFTVESKDTIPVSIDKFAIGQFAITSQ